MIECELVTWEPGQPAPPGFVLKYYGERPWWYIGWLHRLILGYERVWGVAIVWQTPIVLQPGETVELQVPFA